MMKPMSSCPALCLSELDAEQLRGKRVLLRCDLNVPLDASGIMDETRIRESLASIKHLTTSGARVLLCSHLGRPKGVDEGLRLSTVAPRLAALLGHQVLLADDCIGEAVAQKAAALQDGEVLLLENTRFHAGECRNDPVFAQELAASADLYVNDAFGCAHRAHASTAGVTNFLKPAVAGLLMKKELDFLCGVMTSPQRPFVAVVGGSKVSTKIGVLESLLGKCDKLLIGGGMVFTFLAARGLPVGASLVEPGCVATARALEATAAARGVQLLLPSDIVVADSFSPGAAARVVPAAAIPNGWMGLDIGPDSVREFTGALQGARTVLWNGPMGMFEFGRFAAGTLAVARAIADLTPQGATTIVGGGDSVAAAEKAGVTGAMSHVSTGGGASLELLEGRALPGVAALTPRPVAPAGQLVAQYIYHCAWNAVFRVLGPLLHRTAGVPPAIAAGDGSVGGSAARMGSSLARSSSRRQLANM